MIGFIGFIIASGLCAIAWNLPSMIVFRIIQGFAVSADYPTAMAIIAITFTDMKERAQALGIWSAAFAVASVFGPLIGGPLIDNFNWRAVFFVNIPLGIIGLFLAITFIDESVGEKAQRKVRLVGIAARSAPRSLRSRSCWTRGRRGDGYRSRASHAISARLLFSILFYKIEMRQDEPIVDFKFFKIPTFVYTLLNNFIVFMALIGAIFLIPIFAETFLGYDATQTGYLFIPLAIALMVAAPLGGRLIGKVKPSYVIFVEHVLLPASGYSCFPTSIRARRRSTSSSRCASWRSRSASAWRSAPTSSPSSCRKDEIGEASAVLALVRNISGAFGVAIFSTLLDRDINANVLQIAQNSILRSTSPQAMQAFIGLSNSRPMSRDMPRFLISPASSLSSVRSSRSSSRVPKEQLTAEHHVVAEG